MHLLIPFASALSEPAAEVVRDLALPSLASLLQRMTAGEADEGDEYTLSPPHERALARAWGWPMIDGGLPFAARAAAADGIDVGDRAWGLLTPAHWDVGRDHVTLSDPQALGLGEEESHALFDAVRDLFESEGITLAWGAPSRWYASHDSLAEHRSALVAGVGIVEHREPTGVRRLCKVYSIEIDVAGEVVGKILVKKVKACHVCDRRILG